MFTQARFKLTLWYLLIIMIVSGIFSVAMYRLMLGELRTGYLQAENHLRAQEVALRSQFPPQVRQYLIADFELARKRVQSGLFVANGIILALSAFASFKLAQSTLTPIQKALEEQRRFVSDASHELHTPLTALKTSIEVALRSKDLKITEAKKVLKDSISEVDELALLSEQLLTLSRFEKNDSSQFGRVDLADIISTVAKRLSPLAKKKNITVGVSTQNEIVPADEASLIKLFTILLDNAIKYTPEKGAIRIVSSKTRSYVKITISDTGIGIAKSDIPHIFDRFYRSDSARTKAGVSGFGLGLAIANRIIDIHRGVISVESKVGKGSTFTVSLPL